MKKKVALIILFIVFSLLCAIVSNSDTFITDSKTIIGLMFTLMGLSFTSFSFISTSITGVMEKIVGAKRVNIKVSLDKMLNSIRDDILLILILVVLLIIVNFLYSFDIPLINDVLNMDFSLFIISSFKQGLHNFATSLICCLAMYAFYDIFNAAFVLIKGYYDIIMKKNN